MSNGESFFSENLHEGCKMFDSHCTVFLYMLICSFRQRRAIYIHASPCIVTFFCRLSDDMIGYNLSTPQKCNSGQPTPPPMPVLQCSTIWRDVLGSRPKLGKIPGASGYNRGHSQKPSWGTGMEGIGSGSATD